jgi:2-isopropylmalate synthase
VGFWEVIAEEQSDQVSTRAIVVGDVRGQPFDETARGNGPVNALDQALRKALKGRFRGLDHVHLTDYKVRILDTHKGTGAVTRVLINSSDGDESWTTIGVSENIIEASWQALEDSLVYGLLRAERRG